MQRRGWRVVVSYSALAALTQTLWLTYAPITTDTARHYGVSVVAVGWLSEIFPLLYVVLAIPAGVLLDRWFTPSLAAAGGVVATGGLLRLGGDGFAWALAGQTLVAIAQPVVMSAVSKLAGEHLPVQQRPAGIAVASAAGFLGMLLALLLGPMFGASHLTALLAIEAGGAVLAALWMALTLRASSVKAGERGAIERTAIQRTTIESTAFEHAAIERGAALALWRRPEIRTLAILSFLGFGAFVALSTWLQTLLHPAGVSDTVAGMLLVGMILAGVIGCAALPPLVQRRGVERGFMRAVVLVNAAGCLALGVLPALGARALAMVVMGALLLPALPVILTLAEQLAGKAAGTAGAIMWLAGNLGGLVVALIVQVLVHEPLAAFLAMAAVVLCGLPLAARMDQIAALGRAHGMGREAVTVEDGARRTATAEGRKPAVDGSLAGLHGRAAAAVVAMQEGAGSPTSR